MSTSDNRVSSIRDWAADERPREKLVQKGPAALSDSEILAILIGSGTRNESALSIARQIMSKCGNSLLELSRQSLADLRQFRGMGEAKSVILLAAIELARRKRSGAITEKKSVTNSREVYEYFAGNMGDLVHEEFWAMYLTRNNRIIAAEKLGEGGLNATVVDPKKVFAKALGNHASSIIVAHNHPSGNLQPSAEDRRITQKLYASGKNLDLPLLDHLIVTNSGYFSFADEGILGAE